MYLIAFLAKTVVGSSVPRLFLLLQRGVLARLQRWLLLVYLILHFGYPGTESGGTCTNYTNKDEGAIAKTKCQMQEQYYSLFMLRRHRKYIVKADGLVGFHVT